MKQNTFRLHSRGRMRVWRQRMQAILLSGRPEARLMAHRVAMAATVVRFESYLAGREGGSPPSVDKVIDGCEVPARISEHDIASYADDFTLVFENQSVELYDCVIAGIAGFEITIKSRPPLPDLETRITPAGTDGKEHVHQLLADILKSGNRPVIKAITTLLSMTVRHIQLRARLLDHFKIIPAKAFRSELAQIHNEFDGLIAGLCRSPDDIYTLQPRTFEELIAELWVRLGYDVELTPQTRDGGRDIIATRVSELRTQVLIECKKYDRQHPVGIGVVQRMLGVMTQYDATQGVIATTSSFTRDAVKVIAAQKNRLAGHGHADLIRLLWRVQLAVNPRPGFILPK